MCNRVATGSLGGVRVSRNQVSVKPHGDAMANLGNLYNDGRGVARDYRQAYSWYEKAAALGDIDGMENLGRLYETGSGVTRDSRQARG